MNPPEIKASVEHDTASEAKPASWLEKNVCRPAFESVITGLYEPTANFINLIPHAVTGNDWLPKVKIDPTQEAAPADAGEYITRLLVHGSIGAFSYAAYGRVAGGLLRKGTTLANMEGRIGKIIGSESSGQLIGSAIHDGLLDAATARERTANVASGLATFATFEFFNKSIRDKHWITRAIAHAPIGFAGGITGYLSKETVAGRQLDSNVAMQAAIDGAAMNVFLPAMQWSTGRAIDHIKDKTGGSIPLERHANYEHLQGKSRTLDALMNMFPATRVNRTADEGASIDHTKNTVHVMPGSPADHLAHELAHKLAFKKYEKDIKYAAGLLKYNEEFAKNSYVETRLQQEQFARQTQLKVAKELLLSLDPHAKIPKPEHSHVLPIYKRMFEMEFDEHFKPSGGKWRPEEDFANITQAKRQELRDSNDLNEIVTTLHPELSSFEQRILKTALLYSNFPAVDLLEGMPRKAFSTAVKWKIFANSILSWQFPNDNFVFENHPHLSKLKGKLQASIEEYDNKIATIDQKRITSINNANLEEAMDTMDFSEAFEKSRLEPTQRFNRNEISYEQLCEQVDPLEEVFRRQSEPARQKRSKAIRNANAVHTEETRLANKSFHRQAIKAIDELNISNEDFFKAMPPEWTPPDMQPVNTLAAALVFGKNVDYWWRARTNIGKAQAYFVPAPINQSEGLSTFYARKQLAPSHYLENAVYYWQSMSTAEKSKLIHGKVSDTYGVIANHRFPMAKCPELAEELCRYENNRFIDESAYLEHEERFLEARSVKDAFPTDHAWQDGNLKGYFLKRTDPRILTLGESTNCCIRIGGDNETGMWWTLHSPEAGFFIVEDVRDNKIVAASRAWNTPNKGVCFNNVESKGLDGKHQQVLDIYKQAARHLVTNEGVKVVNVGILSGELDLHSLPDSSAPLALPADIQGSYDCRFEQKELARQ